MSEFLWVKLSEGKRVRDPISHAILAPEKIYRVRYSQFWLRRVDSGDVVICGEPKENKVEVVEPKASPKKKAGEK